MIIVARTTSGVLKMNKLFLNLDGSSNLKIDSKLVSTLIAEFRKTLQEFTQLELDDSDEIYREESCRLTLHSL